MTKKRFISTFLILLSCSILLGACNFASSLASPTATPTSALLPSPTPTFVPPAPIEKTPEGEARFAQADLALAFGDYAEALKLFGSPPPENTEEYKATALFGQALTHFKSEDLYQSRRSLDQLMRDYPQTLAANRGNFLLAMISGLEDEFEDAIHFYQSYLKARPGMLVAETWTRIGDAYTELNQSEKALNAYELAWQEPGQNQNDSLGLKLAESYNLCGNADKALEIYLHIYNNTSNIYTKSQVDLQCGRLEIARGNNAEGYAYYQDAVNNFPSTYDAFSALVALIDADQEVNELQRGIINFNVNQHNLAIEALDRYLEGDGLEKDVALYYKALATRAYGLTQAGFNSEERIAANRTGGTTYDKDAIALWTEIIEKYPQSVHHLDAIEDIIYTQNAYMGQIRLASESAIAYASMPNGADYAPTLFYTAGAYYLLDDQVEKAADTWTNIGIAYPASTQAFNGLFFAGALYYQLEKYDEALQNFNRALLIADAPLEVAGAHLWIGKTKLAKGDQETARLDWQNAMDADPNGYYGIRAKELFEDKQPFAEEKTFNLKVNLEDERILAADWLKYAFSLPPDINLDYSSALAEDPHYINGMEYDRLGLYKQANLEFETLRQAHEQDAANTFRLMKTFLDQYYYQSAIECARTLRQLAGYGETPVVAILPPYLAYVEYGAYYLPWVEAKAEKYGLSPILLLSVIHQESRFGTQATSSAGARGLLQLMPETAEQIANETGFLENFSPNDLEVPFYNLELGANYLARQFFVFGGDPYLALAAYNAGPGNVLRWQELNKKADIDFFLSAIPYLETRVYVRRITEIHHLYRRIYED